MLLLVRDQWAGGQPVDYLIVDEAGFLTDRARRPARRARRRLARRRLLLRAAHRLPHPAAAGRKRLFELADEIAPVHVEVLCWCGRPGQLNARVVDGRVVREGDTVVVADTAGHQAAPTTVHYQVLCRMHHRRGDLGGTSIRGQLASTSELDGRPRRWQKAETGTTLSPIRGLTGYPRQWGNPASSRFVEPTAYEPTNYSSGLTPTSEEVPTMADRTLRGSRLGAISYETEYGAEPAPRNIAAYRCERGHEFSVPFSEEAEIPSTWDCRLDGSVAKLIDGPEPEAKKTKAPAYPLGHAHGAPHDRRPRRGPRRAARRAACPPGQKSA